MYDRLPASGSTGEKQHAQCEYTCQFSNEVINEIIAVIFDQAPGYEKQHNYKNFSASDIDIVTERIKNGSEIKKSAQHDNYR